jgi:hypothetical protein
MDYLDWGSANRQVAAQADKTHTHTHTHIHPLTRNPSVLELYKIIYYVFSVVSYEPALFILQNYPFIIHSF